MAEPNRSVVKGTSEHSIDEVNTWIRSTPQYQALLQSWGKDPGHPSLSKTQSEQVLRLAQSLGVQVDQGRVEVDNHGNLNPKGHKMRNTLIVAGIVGGAIAAPYVIPALAGSGSAGAGAAGVGSAASGTSAAGAGGVLGSTTIGTGMIGPIAGGTGMGVGTAGTIGGLTAGGAMSGGGSGGSIIGSTGKFLTSSGGLSLGKTLADTFTNIYAGKQQIAASDRAADLAYKANQEALAFQQAESERNRAEAESTRHANYDQWAARERRIGSLGSLIGEGPREIPAYVPINGSTGSAGGGDSAKAQQIIQSMTGGLAPTSQSLDAVIAELKKNGIEAERARHGVNGSLASDDKLKFADGSIVDLIGDVGGANAKWMWGPDGPAAPTSAPYRPMAGSIAALSSPYQQRSAVRTAPLSASMYLPGSLGSLARS